MAKLEENIKAWKAAGGTRKGFMSMLLAVGAAFIVLSLPTCVALALLFAGKQAAAIAVLLTVLLFKAGAVAVRCWILIRGYDLQEMGADLKNRIDREP